MIVVSSQKGERSLLRWIYRGATTQRKLFLSSSSRFCGAGGGLIPGREPRNKSVSADSWRGHRPSRSISSWNILIRGQSALLQSYRWCRRLFWNHSSVCGDRRQYCGVLPSPVAVAHTSIRVSASAVVVTSSSSSSGGVPHYAWVLSALLLQRMRGIGRRHVFVGLLNLLSILFLYQLMGIVQDRHIELLYLYYQPFAPFLAMLWGWGVNVLYFERSGIKYDLCFEEDDRRHLIHGPEILKIANTLTWGLMTSATAFLLFCSLGNVEAAAMQPPLLYIAAAIVFIMPLNIFYRDTRRYFASTLWRVVTPVRQVLWADFLLADILTSLAKGLSDLERAVCAMASGSIMYPDTAQCSDASWIIPFGLAVPYAIRLVQCVRVYRDSGNGQQLFNAIKYTTAFPVVFLSFAKYHVGHDAWVIFWKPLWLLAAVINSAYSYFWDVERDWEISYFSQMGPRKSLHPRTILPSPTHVPRHVYAYLMISNLILRLAWTYKLSPHLRRNHAAVFWIVILEAFRRFQWVFVRVEVELRKKGALNPVHQHGKQHRVQISLSPETEKP